MVIVVYCFDYKHITAFFWYNLSFFGLISQVIGHISAITNKCKGLHKL